jgi:hypothetical protein
MSGLSLLSESWNRRPSGAAIPPEVQGLGRASSRCAKDPFQSQQGSPSKAMFECVGVSNRVFKGSGSRTYGIKLRGQRSEFRVEGVELRV